MKIIKEKKLLAWMMTVCICVGSCMLPVSASMIGDEEYKPISYNGKVSKEGIVLKSGCYEVTEDTILNGKEGQSAVKIEGDVTIYVAKGKTLTCNGGAGVTGKKAGESQEIWEDIYGAEGGGGGGAGIELPVGSQLTIIGQGAVTANGGNGGAGGAAADGSQGSDNRAENTIHGGAGGSGAGGGGGAGAGIGTVGAVGGAGGDAVIPESRPIERNDYLEYDPVSGNPGKDSEQGQYYCGNMVVKDDIALTATGGNGGPGGTTSDHIMGVYIVERSYGIAQIYFIAGGGGNGGPGGNGADGQAFGHGGTAGGGGGAGNTGGMRHCSKSRKDDFCAGGRGGEAGMNANESPLQARGEDAHISGVYVKTAEDQTKCEGGKVSGYKKENVNPKEVCKASFTSTAKDISSVKTDSMSATANTLVAVDVNGNIYKRIYGFSKEGLEVPQAEEGFVFRGWKDEEGNLVTNGSGELTGEANAVWRTWEGGKLVPDYKRIKDPAYIDQGVNELGEITLDKAGKIKELRDAYDVLTPEEKEQVTEYQKLQDAENQLLSLSEIAAKELTDAVNKIGPVDFSKAAGIREIRKTYDQLPETAKQMISEEILSSLTEAEKELEIQEQKAAEEITEEIKEIGTVDLTKEEKISEIREKYEKLPEAVKDKIPEEVKNILIKAEQQITEINKQESRKPVIHWKAGVKKVQIAWNKIPEAKGYYIYGYDRKTKKTIRLASLPATASSYTVNRIGKTKLADGTIYQLAVRPHRIENGKPVYDQAVRVNVMTAPKCVVLTSVKKQGSAKAKLSWKKVKGVSGYQVLEKSGKHPEYKVVKTLKGNKTVIKGLSKKQEYTFRVRAIRKYDGKTIAGPLSNEKRLK